MTITLRWWFVPLVILAIGVIGMHRDKSTGLWGGCAGAVWFAACCLAAVAFTIGHYT